MRYPQPARRVRRADPSTLDPPARASLLHLARCPFFSRFLIERPRVLRESPLRAGRLHYLRALSSRLRQRGPFTRREDFFSESWAPPPLPQASLCLSAELRASANESSHRPRRWKINTWECLGEKVGGGSRRYIIRAVGTLRNVASVR